MPNHKQKVRVKSKSTLSVRRAGHLFTPAWTEVELGDEQLRGVQADDQLEVQVVGHGKSMPLAPDGDGGDSPKPSPAKKDGK